jgi:pimeloyl-ACP methyl ester carboxylesterase
MRGLALNQAVVGGHSMGGSTAGEFGARYPELARSLVLEDPAWFIPEEPAKADSEEGAKREESEYERWLKIAHSLSIEEITARCRANDPKWSEVELYPWAVSKQQFDPNFLVTRGERKDWRKAAAKIHSPTLLITSEHAQGAIVTPETAALAVGINPLIQVAYVPDAGHNIRRDNYTAFLAVLRAFLNNLP